MTRQVLATAGSAGNCLASIAFFSTWTPWMPRSSSLHAPAIDALMRSSLAVLGVLFIAAQILLLAGMFLPRQKRPRFSSTWRWIATLAFASLLVWMTVVAEKIWFATRIAHASVHAVQVEVTGMQFQWYFRYPGPDGIYGKTRPNLVDAAGGNPLGIDPADPRGADDVVSSVLVLPLDRQIDLHLRSLDVVHGFFIPSMRVMENATPGSPAQIHLTPTRLGDFAIVCTQLCGLGHYRMHAVLRVVTAHDYDAWMAQQEASLQGR